MRRFTQHFPYWLLGLGISAFLFLAIVWGPAIPLWLSLITTGSLSNGFRLSTTIFWLALSDSDMFLVVFYALLSALTGAAIALLAYYWKTRRLIAPGGATTGALGAFIAVLGFGCASCGTLFISLLATSVGGASLAAAPLGGGLVWLLRGAGIALLVLSVARLVKHVNDPLVCPIE